MLESTSNPKKNYNTLLELLMIKKKNKKKHDVNVCPKKLRYIFHHDHLIAVLAGFLLFGLLRLFTINISFLNPIANALENFSVSDIFFEIQRTKSKTEVNDMITIVDMTDLSDRGSIACLLEEIWSCNPLIIGVDLIFEGKKNDSLADELLKNSVNAIGNRAVYSTKLVDYNRFDNSFNRNVCSFFLEDTKVVEGYTNLNDDMEKRCIRDFSITQMLNNDTIYSFPTQIASNFNKSLRGLKNRNLLINYKNETFPVVKYNEIQDNPELIDGHIILVGALREEQDMHNTPIGKMSGLEIQAYSLLTLIEQKDIKKIPSWVEWVLTFLICYILEVIVDVIWQYIKKKKNSAFCVFLKESNLISIAVLFMGLLVICWLTYVLFVRHSIIVSGGFVMGMMVLTCEGRDILISIAKAIVSKNQNCKIAKSSLLLESYPNINKDE